MASMLPRCSLERHVDRADRPTVGRWAAAQAATTRAPEVSGCTAATPLEGR